MNLPILFAKRLLFYKRSVSFISIITVLSIIGITAGVAALICVSSIFNGFGTLYFTMLTEFDPHIRIILPEDKGENDLHKKIIANDIVQSSFSMRESKVICSHKSSTQPFILRTVDKKDSNYIASILKSTGWGNKIIGNHNDIPHVVIGAGVSDKLKVAPGDTISLLTLSGIEQAAQTMSIPQSMQVIIGGVFLTNIKEYDGAMMYSYDESFPTITKYATNLLEVRLHDKENVGNYINELSHNKSLTLLSWRDLHSDIYGVVDFERMVSFIIVGLVVVVSAFNILASLSMTVIQKRRDIALMKSIGASDSLIARIFLTQGMIIGIFSTTLGAVLGIALCLGQQHFGWIKLDSAVSIVPSLPVSIDPQMVVFAIVSSLLLCFLATIYPARRAAQMSIPENIIEN